MLGILLVGAWYISNDSSLFPISSTPSVTTDVSRLAQGSGAVSVMDQPAGRAVTIESLTVPPPGVWIAVREVNGNDLGNVLGAVRANGPRRSIQIPLLRDTVLGSLYAVELYRDNGDDVFDLATDSVYVDFASGAPAVSYFKTTD